MRVLVIEDQSMIAKAVQLMLTAEGFNVYSTDLGEEGLELGKVYDYDVILLLSGISDVETKVCSFGFGADDYLTKPFYRDELVARIHALVRRSKGHSHSVIRTGKLTVNLDTKTVEVDGTAIFLADKEYAALELLSLRKGDYPHQGNVPQPPLRRD